MRRLAGPVSHGTRWTLTVSRDTDDALRRFLAGQGRGQRGRMSRFVEEAVRARILDEAAMAAKRHNARRSAAEIEAAVDAALEWARGG